MYSKQVKLEDIARVLKISKVAVSKALRNHPDISEETKKRVRELAIQLDYSPNLIARNLSTKKTNTIGVVVPDVANPFFASAIDGIVDVALDAGYQTILTVSRENSVMEQQNIQKLLSMRVEGLLVCISQQTNDPLPYERLARKKVKLVFFDRAIKNVGFDSVTVNDRKGASQLVEYVLQLGYAGIAHLAGYSTLDIGKNRRLGFLDAMRKYKMPVKSEWVLEGGFNEEDGYHEMQKLLQIRNCPEVVYTVNIPVAKGAYKAIREKQLRIPDDVAVVGFGYGEYANMLNPPLTIMRQDPEAIGRKATEILIDQIEQPVKKEPKNIIIPLEFSIGQSCKTN
jgi:LacI family transcriptional regulator